MFQLNVPVLRGDATVEFGRGESAVWGCEMLGAEGKRAVPELLAVTRAKRWRTQILAGRALGVMGAEGVPALLSLVTNRAVPLFVPMQSWQCLGTNAVLTVPFLVEQVRNTNRQVAVTSLQLLGVSHVQPEVVVPALSNAALSSDRIVRLNALSGLGAFGQDARAVTPMLVECLGDSDSAARVAATNALRRIAPEVLRSGGK
jgi:hypothetical protein